MAIADKGSLPIVYDCSTRSASSAAGTCGWVELVTLFQQAITFAIYLASVVVFFVLLRTGFKMITSGSADELSEAKKSLGKVLAGYFFMLVGWLLVKYILTTLGVNENYQLLAPL
ncbi:MAG: pilin [bacterium]